MPDSKQIDEVQVMGFAISRTCSYFQSEYGISVTEVNTGGGDQNSLDLLDMTAIIGMGGRVNLLIAFSFNEELINVLYKRMTDDFAVQPDEVEMYREAAAGEVANTILGHCTIDLQKMDGPIISMTPPIILERVKAIRRMKNKLFYTRGLNTDFGRMNISFVGHQEQFDTNLDYVK